MGCGRLARQVAAVFMQKQFAGNVRFAGANFTPPCTVPPLPRFTPLFLCESLSSRLDSTLVFQLFDAAVEPGLRIARLLLLPCVSFCVPLLAPSVRIIWLQIGLHQPRLLPGQLRSS